MPNDQKSSIKFALEESVFFKSGQEVDELISISLSPNITVLKEEEFVILKGALELSGEYIRSEENENNEQVSVLKGKYVQQVDEREEGGTYSFYHQFPVYITIPENRINDLDDLSIEVHSFDYLLPEQSSLTLQAELYVFGLQGEKTAHVNEADVPSVNKLDLGLNREDFAQLLTEEIQSIEAQEKQEKRAEQVKAPDDQTHSVESAESVSKEEEATPVDIEEVSYEKEVKVETNRDEAKEAIEEKEEDEKLAAVEQVEPVKEPVKEKVTERDEKEVEVEAEKEAEEELYEPFTVEARAKEEKEQEAEKVQIQQQNVDFPFPKLPNFDIDLLTQRLETEVDYQDVESSTSSFLSSSFIDEVEQHSQEESTESSEESPESSSDEEPKVKKKKDKYHSMSFAEFFARKEEETTSAKLKVCLVQESDSIETIADKYDVSVQQILRANELNPTDDVYEGQVLYIPEKTAYRK